MINLIKNKKGLLPRNWIVIVVLIGMLITAATFWIGAWNDKYSSVESSNLSSSFNSIDEIARTTNTMETKLQSETRPTTLGWLDFIVTGGYQVLITVLSVPLILKNFVSDIDGQFGIPRIYIDGVIILISVGAIFGIIGAIFRRKT